MHDQELDRLFARFRQRGDVEALGAIFDALAPELLRVAMSLVREPNEADDLLQQTFLTAIERARRFDTERRLAPWLLGILAHHARERRRLRARQLDPARVTVREVEPPEAHAAERELAHELEHALAGFSQEERAVLEAYLEAGRSAAEIARERGLAPGAVRMRIHRGLERLRKLLPAGLALGGSAGALHGQGLAHVRAAVLRAAEGSAPAAGAAGGGILGGILMAKKVALGVGLALVAAGLWLLVGHAGRGNTGVRSEVAHVLSAAARRAEESRPAAEVEAAGVEPVPETSTTRAPAFGVLDPDLAGLRGRVVENDGTPVRFLPVELLEVDEAELFPSPSSALEAPPVPRLVAARTVTDREGVFLLQGARTGAVHNLGLDLGGERATLRVLDASLAPGATADVGDIVLASYGAVAGRVVDEQGNAVAGARVRLGTLPAQLVGLGLQELAAGGALAEAGGSGLRFVFELPAWLSAFEEKLPLSTTRTDADGRFVLAWAPAGIATALIDAPGFARLTRTLRVQPGERVDEGSLVLARGSLVVGRVLDAEHRPVAGAEVRAGSSAEPREIAVLGPVCASDSDGRFRFEHVPQGKEQLVIARRDAQSRWSHAFVRGGEATVELPAELELVVEVVDDSGAPVAAPEFFLRPLEFGSVPEVLAPPMCARAARSLEAGRWNLGALALGRYLVAARAAGLGETVLPIELGADAAPRFVLASPRSAEVLVLDAATRAPVAGALVRAEEDGSWISTTVSAARTGEDGRATLALPERTAPPLWLAVEHARFAPQVRALAGSGPYEFTLTPGARLVARLEDPELARAGCSLQLEYRGTAVRSEVHLPHPIAVPRTGTLELELLPAGEWSWNLFESVTAKDALLFLDPEHAPQHYGQGKFTLAEGQTLELVLPCGIRGAPGPVATLSGVVRIDGRPAGGLQVKVCPIQLEPGGETLTQETHDGRFRFDDVPAGQVLLFVESAQGTVLAREGLELVEGEERTVEYDVAQLSARIRVRTEDGRAGAGAEVRLEPVEGETSPGGRAASDADGLAQLTVSRTGRYEVFATHAEEGMARGELEVTDAGGELELVLARGVECSGRVRLEPGVELPEDTATLLASRDSERWINAMVEIDLRNGPVPFRFVGFTPGTYSARLLCGTETFRASFVLPRSGSSALELSFR